MMNVKWALRRINIGKNLPASSLVLEVGSGGNPFPRSNVLVDAHEETQERHWDELIADRPTILTHAEDLPFKDKAFDFVIASHVLEHSAYPEKFLSELQRVARAGYIETPDAFMERINPYKDHRLEVTVRDQVLVISKKSTWLVDSELVELYEKEAKSVITKHSIPAYPNEFHVCFWWEDTIDFVLTNPDVDATWQPIESSQNLLVSRGFRSNLRQALLKIFRLAFSQNRRNKEFDILKIMRCPVCKSDSLSELSRAKIVAVKNVSHSLYAMGIC